MMNNVNIGDNVTLPNGMSGSVWGKRTTEDGDFVQFSSGGEWHTYVAPAEEAAAEVKVEETKAADPAHETEQK